RATLLLANAFSGFLENEHPQDSGHTHSDGKPHHMYSYGVHEEEGVRVSEGGYPPYEISMFVVFSLDEVNLATNIDLAVSLVRANRKEKRVEDRSGIFKNPLDFAQAPVAIALHELIRDKQLSDEDWEALSIIDWSDLPNAPWDTMTDEAFDNYLESKGKIPLSVANGIRRLRHRMRILFDPDQAISHHLVNQDEVVLPLLADRNRRIRCLIPFVKLGFV
ncbi:MAG TPA: hypothetical protein VJC10_02115, partial [Patescibacteria group bacterium]|nr:hypothetical protein [Patescibacteria group bacterium]